MMSLLIKTMRETMGHFLQKFEKILKLNTFNNIQSVGLKFSILVKKAFLMR